jgi:hypothetical protein
MRRVLLTCMLAGACATPALAQIAPAMPAADTANIRDLDVVVVRGVQPGPGLWKVSKGDHVLWVLGTLSPLPKDITWNSRHVEAVIATSQEVLTGPEVGLTAKTGFLGLGLVTLLPSLIGLRNNPDGAMLKDVVTPALYARWSVLKEKYIGSNNKVEQWRPIFAALDLYSAAIDKAGLTDKLLVQKTVTAAAKHAGVKITTPSITITIDDPKAAVKEFKVSALDDLDCFGKTLDRIDTDLGVMTVRANAWSTGDLNALRKLPYTDQMAACAEAISETQLARKRGGADIKARAEQAWLDAATSALTNNHVTFAMLPIARLLRPDGYPARLQAMGYTVEEPAAATGNGVEAKSTDAAEK